MQINPTHPPHFHRGYVSPKAYDTRRQRQLTSKIIMKTLTTEHQIDLASNRLPGTIIDPDKMNRKQRRMRAA